MHHNVKSGDPAQKRINIDFLYLDRLLCRKGAGRAMREALERVPGALRERGFFVALRCVHIQSRELAVRYRPVSSPTIRGRTSRHKRWPPAAAASPCAGRARTAARGLTAAKCTACRRWNCSRRPS